MWDCRQKGSLAAHPHVLGRDVRMDSESVRITRVLTLLLELQPGLVFFHEGFDFLGSAQEAVPLLVVESDRENGPGRRR